MKRIIIYSILVAGFVIGISSCIKDLNTIPLDPDEITSATVYENAGSYYQVLAKVYAGLAVSGQQGPAGMPDISGIDEGFSTYIRQYWKAQELPTDEAVIAWNDGSLRDYHEMDWTSSSEFVTAMYNRIYYQISLCNEFIRESAPAKLDERGFSESEKTEIARFQAEARFMRALSYYHALDMFGNVPFVTDADKVGAFFPEQIQRADLFDYVESELLVVEPMLAEPRTNEYGRADKAAAWSLLAKLYLNSSVYNGTDHNADCVTYCEKVMNAGYSLESKYANLFRADNNLSNEMIFPVTFDGMHTQTWGGMTFVIHAAIGGSMVPANYGVEGPWGGTRVTKAFVHKFYPDLEGSLKISPTYIRKKSGYPVLHVPGSYQGWDPSLESTIVASVNSDDRYEGYLWFADAGTQFKYTQGTTWDVNWGDDGADGTLERNGANLVAATAGYYKLNVDLNTMTHTFVKTEWGVIGSATANGWDGDQNMTYDAVTDTWSAVLDLTAGEMKFRANDDWGINLGDNGADGTLEQDGANIPIPANGTYTITMKLGAPDYTYTVVRASFDRRAMFHTDGQTLDIDNIFEFTNGYAVTKFSNLTSGGVRGSHDTFVDTDFPLFRLADIYLMYAEAVLRGGGGSASRALQVVNDLQTRAYTDASANLSADELTLDFILDERARELYWEGTRRTDLIRFGKFTGGEYLWPWKGNVKEGTTVDSHYKLFPIPASDLGANPNLQQNPGYGG